MYGSYGAYGSDQSVSREGGFTGGKTTRFAPLQEGKGALEAIRSVAGSKDSAPSAAVEPASPPTIAPESTGMIAQNQVIIGAGIAGILILGAALYLGR